MSSVTIDLGNGAKLTIHGQPNISNDNPLDSQVGCCSSVVEGPAPVDRHRVVATALANASMHLRAAAVHVVDDEIGAMAAVCERLTTEYLSTSLA